MKPECLWHEETVVDFILGELSGDREKQFREHVVHCETCRGRLREWDTVFEDPKETTRPSPMVKQRLMKKVKPKRSLSMPVVKRPALPLIALCTALFVFFQSGVFSTQPVRPYTRPVNGGLPASVQSGMQQVHYVPVNDHNVKGYVWLNLSTNELMLFLNGLSHLQGKDYQAWIVTSGYREDAGLLKVDHGMAQLYFRGRQLEQARHIVVSVEPRGGSEIQTGPGKFMIPLRHQ